MIPYMVEYGTSYIHIWLSILAGKTKESFGELLRKRSGKEGVIYSDHLREHFMPEVFLLSPSTI